MSRAAASAVTSAAGERTLTQWAELAEQAVRVMTHRTRPALTELTDPADAAEVIADLASLAAMLPQLLDQLARWLLEQQHDGRMRVDFLAPQSEVCQAVHAAVGALAHAGECSRRAGHALDTAHQHAAHLATTDDNGPNSEGEWDR
ncbi:MAG TPA: hypothetical protein VEK80_14030 [Kribbellaceae bacterium]|nr:hypothetical protein [Kribbellaceae bacterium]